MFPLHWNNAEGLADAVRPASIYHNLTAVIEAHCLKHRWKAHFSAICLGRTQVRNKGISFRIPPSISARCPSFPTSCAWHFHPPSRSQPINLIVFISALISCCLDHRDCLPAGSISGSLHMVTRDSFLSKDVIPRLDHLPWFSTVFRAKMVPTPYVSTKPWPDTSSPLQLVTHGSSELILTFVPQIPSPASL